MKRRIIFANALVVLGLSLAAYGIHLIYPPMAYLAIGISFLIAAVKLSGKTHV